MIGPVSNLNIIADEDSIDITWTDPSDSGWIGTKLVRKEGDYPLDPNDGVTLIDSKVRNSFSTNPFKDIGALTGRIYYYKLFPYDIVDSIENYNFDKVNNIRSRIVPTPPSSIKSLMVNATKNSILMQWDDPDDIDWAGTLIIRKIGSAPTSELDGIKILNSTVRNAYSQKPFVDTKDLKYEYTYFYGIFPYDNYKNYNLDSVNIRSVKILDSEPPVNVTNLMAIPNIDYNDSTNNSINLTWGDPLDPDWQATVVVKKVGSYPVNIEDGTVLITNNIRNKYINNPFIDKDVVPGIKYFYKLIPYDVYLNYNYSLANNVDLLFPNTNPLDNISDLNVTASKNSFLIQWTDPQNENWAGTKVIRKLGGAPESETDGTEVVNSIVKNQYQSTGFLDSTITTGTLYFYGVFPYDINGVYNVNPLNIFSIESSEDTSLEKTITFKDDNYKKEFSSFIWWQRYNDNLTGYLSCKDTTSNQVAILNKFTVPPNYKGILNFEYFISKIGYPQNGFRVLDNDLSVFSNMQATTKWESIEPIQLSEGDHIITFEHTHNTYSTDVQQETRIRNIVINFQELI